MTFNDLLFFYALISCPSNQSETKIRRQTLKNFFDAAFINHANQPTIKTLNNNLQNQTSDAAIQKLLGDFSSEHGDLIKSVIQQISADFKTAVIDTITHHSKEYERPLNGYQNYMEECRQEAYPNIETYQSLVIARDAFVVTEYQPLSLHGPTPMPNAPSFNPNRRFFTSPSTEKQPLVQTDAQKPICTPCCSLL